MELPRSTSVLIVGAGPTGLATALSLIHHEFRDFVIVDAVVKENSSSRAIVVHAATLEALDTIGCGDELVSKGTKVAKLKFGTRSAELVHFQFDALSPYTRHPYALIIPQTFTEHVLGEKLAGFGVTVYRPHKVVDVKVNADNANLANVVFEDGQVITARYVITADGAHSTIRTAAGIAFVDPKSSRGDDSTILQHFALADVTFDTQDLDESDFRGIMSPNNFSLCALLPSTFNEYLAKEANKPVEGRIYRIVCGALQEGGAPHSPSKEYMQTLIDKFGPLDLSSDPDVNPRGKAVCIKDIIWSSRFRTHSAIADTFFTRLSSGDSSASPGPAILLVGDAAHIHSPAGGQGMNLGIRDAVFLGEVLVKHVKATESMPVSEADRILTEFVTERRAHALEVIRFTKTLLSIGGMKDETVAWWLPVSKVALRDWVLWMLGKVYYLRREAAWSASGLGRR